MRGNRYGRQNIGCVGRRNICRAVSGGGNRGRNRGPFRIGRRTRRSPTRCRIGAGFTTAEGSIIGTRIGPARAIGGGFIIGNGPAIGRRGCVDVGVSCAIGKASRFGQEIPHRRRGWCRCETGAANIGGDLRIGYAQSGASHARDNASADAACGSSPRETRVHAG